MANDNNINIGSIGTGSTVNIAQHQAPETPLIEYAVVQGSVSHLSPTEVHKGVLAFWGSASLPILAMVADSLGVLSFIGVQTIWVLAVVIPVAFVIAAMNNDKRKIAELSPKRNEAKFIEGRWVEQDEDGNYLLYRKAAPCTYPKCAGSVSISPAPPREQGNHSLVGICDVGGRRHTYTVDYNGIGYPHQFDWRPLEERK
jgi:hypothetical protein